MEEESRILKKKKRQRQIRRRVALFTGLLVLVGIGLVLYIKYAPTNKQMDPKTWFEQQTGAALSETSPAVVLQDHVTDTPARLENGQLYLPYNMVRENIFTRYYWDEENAVMLFTTAYENITFTPDQTVYTVDGEETESEYPVVISRDDGLYVLASHMEQYVNVRISSYPEAYHILVDYKWGERQAAVVKKKTAVRANGGVKGLILTRVEAGGSVGVLEQGEKWSQVVTEDGYIGYLQNKCLEEVQSVPFEHEFDAPEYPSLRLDDKVNLIWHQIGHPDSNGYLEQDTSEMTGVNVISPTWFFLSDNEGNFTSHADKTYVKKAHKAGLQVWGLVSNFSEDMSTRTLMASTSARLNLAQNLVDAALEYKLDGINVDFEAITEDAAYGYVQFMREISILCRKNGLILSVDIPVPYDFNLYYDRKELGTVVDYVIIMGYDEHYVGSDAGSVASLSFEEDGVRRTLRSVPAEKIVSGIPFYIRIWYSQTDENGEESVWSEILSMNAVTRTLETYDVTPVWDEEAGQYYAQWTLDDGIECRIWVEDEASIEKKVALVSQYDLGGVAAWALGFERNTIWDVISEGIKDE